MKKIKKKVFVGLSGGVDSSVAAYLLKKRGFDVIGVFIRSYNVDGCQEEDAEFARRVAEFLKIPFYVFDLHKEYFSQVVTYMLDEYRQGKTPNPDVMCNSEIKFGLFLNRAKELGADYISTGHYVVKKRSGGGEMLFVAKDKNKDQSYFLWMLGKKEIQQCIFPIGKYTKPQVRKIAEKIGLPTARKKDSQGICFLGKVKLPDFLKQYMTGKKGSIVDVEDNIIGEHDGVQFYTIGQRHFHQKIYKRNKNTQPYYIVDKNVKKNILIVAEGKNHPRLFKKEIFLNNINFVDPIYYKKKNLYFFVKIRYRQPIVRAFFKKEKNNHFRLIFDTKIKFSAPGQSAVFYTKNGALVGGGIIEEEQIFNNKK